NRAVSSDFVDEMGGGDQFREARILLENVQYVSVFWNVTRQVGVESASLLAAGGNRVMNGFVQLTFFQDFLAVGRNEVTHIAAERIDPGLELRRVEINVELSVMGGEDGGIVWARGLPEVCKSSFECAGSEKIKTCVLLWWIVGADHE